ncbi:LAQU0S01e09736g1_1 [Lachancea quebecensis]|uniref:LAQU0S01e09736g1_1 n=1 Tax=Lachancea quebecensis TaxID=1654605 RepID=A0A0P1KVC3_9SACH|nr:LAQU0S01e09736g1_1 [Lachancea quebecensis]
MDPELQALREARLAELKNHANPAAGASARPQKSAAEADAVAALLQPQALERLSRVALVRPERARAVEAYLQQLAARGQLSHKVSEPEIVDILNGVARDEQRRSTTRIIFDRRDARDARDPSSVAPNGAVPSDDDDDDFFD